MKKFATLALATLAVMLTPMIVSGADEDAEVTLTGEPVDIKCFLGGASGEGHATCAKSCAGKGLPIGLFVKDGDKEELYLVIGGDAKNEFIENMGVQVKATGKVTKKGGMKVLTLTKVEA